MREFLVSGLREFLGPKGVKLPVTLLAKWKTATQMAATGVLIVSPYISVFVHYLGLLGLIAATILTIITGWEYFKTAWPHLK